MPYPQTQRRRKRKQKFDLDIGKVGSGTNKYYMRQRMTLQNTRSKIQNEGVKVMNIYELNASQQQLI